MFQCIHFNLQLVEILVWKSIWILWYQIERSNLLDIKEYQEMKVIREKSFDIILIGWLRILTNRKSEYVDVVNAES